MQEALDEIEYCTGDSSTKWGQERAKDGHPDPFKIQYVEIGNEDQFDRNHGNYDARFAQFYDAIKAKYPNLQLIATPPVKSRKPDVIDDHYYRSSRAMERDVHHYDKTNRNGPKIFVGEWATTEGRPTPNFGAALADAAWLTGLERNSDIVIMNCYAPLLVNVNINASQWGTNLIGYNAISSFGSASYYGQKMFAQNLGDTELPVEISEQKSDQPPPPPPAPTGGVGVATCNTEAQFKDIKVASGDQTLFQSDFSQNTDGWRARGGELERCGWRSDPNFRCHQLPHDRRRSRVDQLHLQPQGPQNQRQRRLPRHVPRPRPKRSRLVERRWMGQLAIAIGEDLRRRNFTARSLRSRHHRGQPLVRRTHRTERNGT